MNNDGVKDALANEEKTKRHALTRSDRVLLRAYFGYSKCDQIPTFPTRDKNTADEFIRKMLFNDDKGSEAKKPKRTDRISSDDTRDKTAAESNDVGEIDKTKDTQNEAEDESFDLNTLLRRDVPTIFQWNLENLKRMFIEAAQFTPNQIISVLRSYTSFDRLYSSDLAISTGFVRLLLIGPVIHKKIKDRNTDSKQTERQKTNKNQKQKHRQKKNTQTERQRDKRIKNVQGRIQTGYRQTDRQTRTHEPVCESINW